MLFGYNEWSLPPANEVWGKVIISQASVILSTGEGVGGWRVVGFSACITGHMTRGVCIWGVCIRGYMGYYGIWSDSGRYASYWNAFLFVLFLSLHFTCHFVSFFSCDIRFRIISNHFIHCCLISIPLGTMVYSFTIKC